VPAIFDAVMDPVSINLSADMRGKRILCQNGCSLRQEMLSTNYNFLSVYIFIIHELEIESLG
jgi:hypothetical protein